jgi:uncharacterized protein YndB with AHSA1/START domain
MGSLGSRDPPRHEAELPSSSGVSVWREQALIEAPVERVWDLIGDPNRHPEWWPLVIEVEGLPRIEAGATYKQVSRVIGGTVETAFEIEELDEMREIKLTCTQYGTSARWLITEAQEATFVDLEMSFSSDRASLGAGQSIYWGMLRVPLARRYLRTWAEASLTGLRAAINGQSARDRSNASAPSPEHRSSGF